MSFEEIKETAKRIERSGNIRAAVDAECMSNSINVIGRMFIMRLIFLYRKYKNKTITDIDVRMKQDRLRELWSVYN